MPWGCFEQTSSTTYPNVLALDYMQRTKKQDRALTREVIQQLIDVRTLPRTTGSAPSIPSAQEHSSRVSVMILTK